MSTKPVLFVNVGWAERYDGTETIRGNHRFLKTHGDDCSERWAFKRRRGIYRCGIGPGRVQVARFDVVIVARQPERGVHRIVGFYRDAQYRAQFENDPAYWGIAVARQAMLLPLGTRPAIQWPGKMGMRRWASEHPHLWKAYQQLTGRRSRSRERASTPRLFVYRWGTNPSLWSKPTTLDRSLNLLRRACAQLDNSVRWEIGPVGHRRPSSANLIRVGDIVIFYAGKRFGLKAGIYGIAKAGFADDTDGERAVASGSWELPVRWFPCSRDMALQPVQGFNDVLAPPGPAATIFRLTRVPRRLRELIANALRNKYVPTRVTATADEKRLLSAMLERTPPAERQRLLMEVERVIRDVSLRSVALSVWPASCAACECALETKAGEHEVEIAHVREVHDDGPDTIANALPLCRTHHWAFDRHLWAIEPTSLQIVVQRHGRRHSILHRIHGKRVRRPVPAALAREFLARRWMQFRTKVASR